MTTGNLSKIIIRKLSHLGQRLKNLLNPAKWWRTFLYQINVYQFLKINFSGVQIGGGDNKIPGFLNIDADWLAKADAVGQAENIKLAENSVGIIYASHILEHIQRKDTKKTLNKWRSVLMPGGILYLALPDLKNLCTVYLENIEKYDQEENRHLANMAAKIIYGGHRNKHDYHYFGYSFPVLKHILSEVGFRDIEIFDAQNLNLIREPDASFAALGGQPVSINVKAIK